MGYQFELATEAAARGHLNDREGKPFPLERTEPGCSYMSIPKSGQEKGEKGEISPTTTRITRTPTGTRALTQGTGGRVPNRKGKMTGPSVWEGGISESRRGGVDSSRGRVHFHPPRCKMSHCVRGRKFPKRSGRMRKGSSTSRKKGSLGCRSKEKTRCDAPEK